MIKKIVIITAMSLMALSAVGLTIKDLRNPQNGDLRLMYLDATRDWVDATRKLVVEEMQVIQALQDREMITVSQRQALISKYETAIEAQWQARPTMQETVDAWNLENTPDEE